MITNVTFEITEYHAAPARFEAGTGNIADAVGLGAAMDYLERLGYEHDLLVYATRGCLVCRDSKLIGTARGKTSVLSFVLDGYRVEDVGQILSREGIAVRAGHHCAQPIRSCAVSGLKRRCDRHWLSTTPMSWSPYCSGWHAQTAQYAADKSY